MKWVCLSCDGSEKNEGRWGEGGIGKAWVACVRGVFEL